MEEAALLYSGGKDSSLAGVLLRKLGFDVTLCTVTFGIQGNGRYAEKAAGIIGFPFKLVALKQEILEDACEKILKDGFPNNGINYLHLQALKHVAEEYDIIADGTRRDDRVPYPRLKEIRSLEDSLGVEYLAPLRGIGYKRINKLAEKMFIVEESDSPAFGKGDYEAEIKALLREKGHMVNNLFPRHKQSRVVGLRR